MTTARQEVLEFTSLGRLPPSRNADGALLTRMTDALLRIHPPVTRDEAILLAASFGPDDCFGLAWTLLHLVESAPGGPPLDDLPKDTRENEWVRLLCERAERR